MKAEHREHRAAAAPARAPAPIRVKARAQGFYGGWRIRKGVVFTVQTEPELAWWMERVDPSTPEQLVARPRVSKDTTRAAALAGASVI